MLHVPKYINEGQRAAVLGSAMSTVETPLGFCFSPYLDGSVERWNFIGGCVAAYIGDEAPLQGEHRQ